MWFLPFLWGLTSITLPRTFFITKWRASVPHDKMEIHQMRSSRITMHNTTLDIMSSPLEVNVWSYFFLFPGIPHLLSLDVNTSKSSLNTLTQDLSIGVDRVWKFIYSYFSFFFFAFFYFLSFFFFLLFYFLFSSSLFFI